RREIIYNLLLALFKPNLEVYTPCHGTSVLRYFKYNYRKEKTELNSSKFFYINSCYINFDGKILREANIRYSIPKF
ncbi:hypothetical protein K469DRAFT_603504, partial [Zopfia rhizophila CBS 207.26]